MAARQLESVECSLQPLDLAFHPTKEILAAGLVDGTVEFHDYSLDTSTNAARIPDEDDDTIISSIPVHSSDIPKFKSTTRMSTRTSATCRATIFNPSGDILYTASNGGSLAAIDVDKASNHHTSDNSILWKIDQASPHGIHTLYHMNPSHIGECIVTGDDEGVIRIWDLKACGDTTSNNDATVFDNCMSLPKGCIASFHENTDIISSFEVDAECITLLATSSDGVLTVIDLRKGGVDGNHTALKAGKTKIEPVKIDPETVQGPFRLHRKSDNQEDELLSMCLMKNGKKIVCGTQQGVLNFWSWGTWGDISDRYPGHPQSIDALLKIDENTLLTGSSDGVVRVLEVQPDQLLGVLGSHDGFPVEKLRFGAGKKVIGSLSHDFKVRLWDASIFYDDDEIDEDMEEMDSKEITSKVGTATQGGNGSEDDWEDVDSDDSMDSDSDSDNDDKKKNRKFKTENEVFFSDF
eukprot:scaffold4425_cov281-Chaetoceros_neogracile.AAC.4